MNKNCILTLALVCIFSCSRRKSNHFKAYKSGLKMSIIRTGEGPFIKKTDEIELYETVTYQSGKVIYSIQKPSKPFAFKVGVGHGIEGLEQALLLMKAGQISKLIIPPKLSKRSSYPPNLSPDSTLFTTIEIVKVLPN